MSFIRIGYQNDEKSIWPKKRFSKQNFSETVIVFIINVIRGHSLDNIFEIYYKLLINHTYQVMILDLVATPNKHTANKWSRKK